MLQNVLPMKEKLKIDIHYFKAVSALIKWFLTTTKDMNGMSGIKSFKILNLLEEERVGEHLLLKELKYSYWYLSKPP